MLIFYCNHQHKEINLSSFFLIKVQYLQVNEYWRCILKREENVAMKRFRKIDVGRKNVLESSDTGGILVSKMI